MRHRPVILAALAVAAPAAAADYTLFVYETPADFAARTDPAKAGAYWAAYGAFSDAAGKAGVLKGGAPLMDPATGGTTGPLDAPRAKAQLSGYFVIEAPDLAAATAWARKLPAAASTRVEIRPNLPVAPAMAAR